MTTWRQTGTEYEATLYKVPLPRFFRFEMGEVEYKRHSNGEQRLQVKFYGVKVPDGASVALSIDGVAICEVVVHRGRGEAEFSRPVGEPATALGNDGVAEIQYNGQALLRGTFRPD